MPPKPDDVYNPVPTVAPETGSGNDYINVRADPNQFGAQVGQAFQRLGAQGQETANQGTGLLLEHQGMLNEAMVTNADTEYAKSLSEVVGQYKSTNGLDSVATQPRAIQAVTELRQKMLATMPNPNAQRAFDTLSRRRYADAVSDITGYGSSQIKVAANKAAADSAELAIQHAADPTIASDDTRFNNVLGDITHNSAWIAQNQGYGPGMRQDPKTGAVSFTDDDNGKMAQAAYQTIYNDAAGKAWKSRIQALSDESQGGNVLTAEKVFQQNRDRIPPQAQLDISSYLAPKVRSAQTRFSADQTLSDWDGKYNAGVQNAVNQNVPAKTINDAIHGQETGGRATAPTSADGAVGGYQIKPDTFARYAKPGEDINNAKDNKAVGDRIINSYNQKYNGDSARVAVAYFSGEGNVAPPGSPTPWKNDSKDANGKSVSSYVSDVQNRLGAGSNVYNNKADFYRANYADISEQARQKAEQEHPDDPLYADQAVARVQQRVNDVIHQQDLQHTVDNHLVYQALNGTMTNGAIPSSVEALRGTNPQVAQAWDRLEVDNPQAAVAIQTKLLTANSHGQAKTYGTKFYSLFQRVLSREDDPNHLADPTALYNQVGPGDNAPLTNTGLGVLNNIMSGGNTPQGQAEAEQLRLFYQNAHTQISGANPATHTADPKGEALFNKFLMQSLPQVIAAKKAGTPLASLMNPKSPDYIGNGIDNFKRPISQWVNDMIMDSANPGDMMSGGAKVDTSTPQGLIDAVKSGKISRADGEKLAIQRGYAVANGPPVPRATF